MGPVVSAMRFPWSHLPPMALVIFIPLPPQSSINPESMDLIKIKHTILLGSLNILTLYIENVWVSLYYNHLLQGEASLT